MTPGNIPSPQGAHINNRGRGGPREGVRTRPRDTYLQPTENVSRTVGPAAGCSGAPAPAAEATAVGAEGVDKAATEAPSSRSALDIRSRAVERPGRLIGAFRRSPTPLGSATRTRGAASDAALLSRRRKGSLAEAPAIFCLDSQEIFAAVLAT